MPAFGCLAERQRQGDQESLGANSHCHVDCGGPLVFRYGLVGEKFYIKIFFLNYINYFLSIVSGPCMGLKI